jgi:hypothetical protein
MLLAMVVLTALAGLAALSIFSVTGGERAIATQRFTGAARYAAESGGAVAMNWLRTRCDPSTKFTAFLATSPPAIPGNNIAPGQPGNLLSPDLQAWYHVEILNNRADPGFATNTDTDATIAVRVTGYGPDGATAIVEWDLQGDPSGSAFKLLGWHEVL